MPIDIPRTEPTAPTGRSPRWWNFGMVWVVIAGPALVVVASFATMAVAFHHADPELHELTPVGALAVRIGAQSPTRAAAAQAADPGPATPPPRH